MLICQLKSMEVRDVEKAASEAAIMLGYSKLKDLQMSVIVSFVLGRDVFGIHVLPTGYGKSLCYQCLPLVFDKLNSVSSGASIVVVLAPLTAIMKDQVCNLQKSK